MFQIHKHSFIKIAVDTVNQNNLKAISQQEYVIIWDEKK